MNDIEFITSPYCHGTDASLCVINNASDSFNSYIPCPNNFEPSYHSISHDNINNKLYVLDSGPKMAIIDVNTKDFEIIPNAFIERNYSPSLINVENNIHLIGGANNNAHFIWNHKNKLFDQIHEFEQYSNITNSSVLYVSSRNILVLIGGSSGHGADIWIFHLKQEKWKRIKEKCAWKKTRAILTNDDKYIIIAGSEDDNDGDDIYVLNIDNIDNVILKKSEVKCPMGGYHHLLKSIVHSVNDELLVIGFIKWLWNSKEFKTVELLLPPLEIMKLIAKWYAVEMVHWIEWNVGNSENQHYQIPVSCILSSTEQFQ
eukprot:347591_1